MVRLRRVDDSTRNETPVTAAFTKLRANHPALIYRGYSLARAGDDVVVTFSITLEPSIEFRPTLSFPAGDLTDSELAPYLFNVGMVELISYWKAACPQRVIIEGYKLSDYQREWWRDLFMHGLGEFYFTNNIDPSDPELLSIESHGAPTPKKLPRAKSTEGELVLAAGGKDSSLALEMLKRFNPNTRREVLILNSTRSASDSVHIAGFQTPLVVRRTIDKNLLSLNAQGYLNGHTPFSAYLAFLGTMIADSQGLSSVIVANERSASEENAIFHGLPVNHQYSKGIRFERRFREYAERELAGSASYYSLIRPLYDLQVSGLFARLAPNHLLSFRSCNVGQREDRWCGACPKCAFVCLTIAPFIPIEHRTEIFGTELFEEPKILEAIEELTGVKNHKPFECVGTLGESRDALVLTLARYGRENRKPPQGLRDIALELSTQGTLPSLTSAQATLQAWTDDHELPADYAQKLRALLPEVG